MAWDGSGLVLFWKRLEHGAFRWPPICDGMMRLSASQLAALIDGLDWSRLHVRKSRVRLRLHECCEYLILSCSGLSHLNICELEQDLEEEGVVPTCLLELSTHGAF